MQNGNKKDFAVGTVLTAPSPATTGLSVTLQSGEGALMPAVPFMTTATPPGFYPTLSNSEKVWVTAIVGDTLTIQRGKSPTTAKSIGVGWFIANGIYADDLLAGTMKLDELLSGTANGTNTVFTTAAAFTQIEVKRNGVVMHVGDDFTVTGTNQITFTTAPASGAKIIASYIAGSTVPLSGTVSTVPIELASGTINGANKVFTTSRPYVGASLLVWINGILQAPTTHYVETTPTTGTFTLDEAPFVGDNILVSYQYAPAATGNADTVDGLHAVDFGDTTTPYLVSDNGGWRKFSVTLTYASATTFTVPGDYRQVLTKGTKIWLNQSGSKYFYVTGTSFSGGLTTVTVNAGSDYSLANAAITSPYFSYMQTPVGFPQWFNFVPTGNVGWSVFSVSNARFKMDGTMCTAWYANSGTSNSTDARLGLPVTCAALGGAYNYEGTTGLLVNNGGVWGTPGRVYLDPGTNPNLVFIVPAAGTGAWTNSGTKSTRFTIVYEVA